MFKIKYIAIISLTIFLLATDRKLAASEQTAPVVLGFGGENNIGKNASSTIYLNLWSTMRRAPWPNPAQLDFGSSITLFNENSVEPYTHSRAEEMAKGWGAHVAVWGRAHRYAGGLLIESKITVPDYHSDRGSTEKADWFVRFNNATFSVKFPVREMNWPNLVLPDSAVLLLSEPFGMPIYASRHSNKVIGNMSAYVTATKFEAGAAKVNDLGKIGWIRYPSLDRFDKPGVVLAAGGIVRMIRGDHAGAIEFFSKLLSDSKEIKATNEVDLLLLRGRANELNGRSGLEDFEHAFSINPFLPSVIEHLIAGIVSTNSGLSSQEKKIRVENILNGSKAFLDELSEFRKL